jgi:hypothetical protein
MGFPKNNFLDTVRDHVARASSIDSLSSYQWKLLPFSISAIVLFGKVVIETNRSM